MKQVLIDIARAIVDNPDGVTVAEKTDGDNVVLQLSVAQGDMGKVIGKQGKIARSIRCVMKAAANKEGKRVTVEIV